MLGSGRVRRAAAAALDVHAQARELPSSTRPTAIRRWPRCASRCSRWSWRPSPAPPYAPPARRSVDLRARRAHRASPPFAIAEPRIAEPRTVAPDSSLGQLNEQSANIRCPFWRTRAYDAVESALAVLNVVELCTFVAARHKSFDPFEPLALPVRWTGPKARGLALEEVMEIVRADFDERQYYVSGELTPSVYSDRCFFDSPDPDMPVRTLPRYSDALHGLFDPSTSRIELLDLRADGPRQFVARWRLEGALKLPWRPKVKPYAGCTRYELDADGLICRHTESWSISAADAFGSTLLPDAVSQLLPGLGAPPAPSADALRAALAATPDDACAACLPEAPPPESAVLS